MSGSDGSACDRFESNVHVGDGRQPREHAANDKVKMTCFMNLLDDTGLSSAGFSGSTSVSDDTPLAIPRLGQAIIGGCVPFPSSSPCLQLRFLPMRRLSSP